MAPDNVRANNPPASGGGLDLLKNNSTVPADCPNTRVPFIAGINRQARKAIIFRPRCKIWACPECGKANAWLWSFHANHGAHALHEAGYSLEFMTITSHEKLTATQSFWVLPKAWMQLQARMRRASENLQYFAVPELQESGKVHIHMITNARATKRWLKDNARECGFGYQNDIQEVWSEGGVIRYINKYLMKTLAIANLPTGTRRVRTSRGWPRAPAKERPDGWTFELLPKRAAIAGTIAALEQEGLDVAIMGSRSAWTVVNPD